MSKPTCTVPGCDRTKRRKLYCEMHYKRLRNTGDLGPAGPLVLSRSGVCKVDDCDSPIRSVGLCEVHYDRMRRRGTTDLPAFVDRGCSVEGCNGKHNSKGLCKKHYQRLRSTGSPPLAPKVERTCEEDGCNSPHLARGLCNLHYKRWGIHGDPQFIMPPKRTSISELVERFEKYARKGANDMGCWEWPGTRTFQNYGVTTFSDGEGRRQVRAIRLAYLLFKGPFDPGLFMCHTCDNPPCVNPDHLYAGTAADNNRDMHSGAPVPRPNPEPMSSYPEVRISDADMHDLRLGDQLIYRR